MRTRLHLPALTAAVVATAAAILPATAHAATTYVVRPGDTLAAVARAHGTTVSALVRANHLASADVIRAGQRLTLPGTTSSAARAATPSPYAPGTRLTAKTTRQVLVADRTHGTYGTYARYEWRGATRGWVRVGTSPVRFGWGGVKAGSQRVAGDGSTPTGTYPMVSAFGVGNPGTRMPYQKVTRCSYWSDERATYNRWVESCGRRVQGEHLADYTTNATGQYRQAAVIGFNYFGRRTMSGKGSGSAIFLHYTRGTTAGCVGLTNRAEMTATVRWLDPAKNPTIVITP